MTTMSTFFCRVCREIYEAPKFRQCTKCGGANVERLFTREVGLSNRRCPACGLVWLHHRDIPCPKCGAAPAAPKKLRAYRCYVHSPNDNATSIVSAYDMRGALKALRKYLKAENFADVREVNITLTDSDAQP